MSFSKLIMVPMLWTQRPHCSNEAVEELVMLLAIHTRTGVEFSLHTRNSPAEAKVRSLPGINMADLRVAAPKVGAIAMTTAILITERKCVAPRFLPPDLPGWAHSAGCLNLKYS